MEKEEKKTVKKAVKKTTKKEVKKEEAVVVDVKDQKTVYAHSIIKNPRVTEKATMLVEDACYTFDVAPLATKNEIAKAIKTLYKVTPKRVNTVQITSKKVMPRGSRKKVGYTSAGKKAYVYLKKGDKIEVL